MSRHWLVLPVVLAAPLPITACAGEGDAEGRAITVLAASSLTGTFTELAERFEADHPGVEVELAFDSSAALAAQAVEGAPADVLATADEPTMDDAVAVLAEPARIFATNTMVMVVPAANEAGVTGFEDVVTGDATYVACVQTAPCGAIWAAIAGEQGVSTEPASLEVDVKAVLAKVTEDEADAGFVYETDAVAAGEAVRAFDVPGAEDHMTHYPIATLDQAGNAALAQEFVDLVLSSAGQEVLAAAGFGAP